MDQFLLGYPGHEISYEVFFNPVPEIGLDPKCAVNHRCAELRWNKRGMVKRKVAEVVHLQNTKHRPLQDEFGTVQAW